MCIRDRHRRYLAICFNIQNGDSTYEYIPCKIKDYDDIDSLRRLHMNNINTKSYTPGEMLMAVEDLKAVSYTHLDVYKRQWYR